MINPGKTGRETGLRKKKKKRSNCDAVQKEASVESTQNSEDRMILPSYAELEKEVEPLNVHINQSLDLRKIEKESVTLHEEAPFSLCNPNGDLQLSIFCWQYHQ